MGYLKLKSLLLFPRFPLFNLLYIWPPVLCLQLLRYVYDKTIWQKRKSKTEITFPNELKLPNSKEVYHLVAVVYHVGNSAHNGHYVNEVLDWETGEWFFCDDDVVVSIFVLLLLLSILLSFF